MFEKEKDPEAIKQNISHKPINYEKLNRLSDDFGKRFTLQQELSAEQAFWLRMSSPTSKPSYASPVKIEAPKELPKISLVNESLKKLKFHLTRFDNVVKIRTTPDASTEGEWGFEHTKAVFNNEIILFLKSLKDIFNVFDKDLLNEIIEVQKAFDQMDADVQQSSVDKQSLEIAKKELLLENDRLLQQIMSQDVLLTVMDSMSLNGESVNMDRKRKESCDKCFNLNERKVFKEKFDSIKKTRVRTKEQSDSLIDKLNLKSAENKDLKAQIQDKVFVITSLKNDLRKVKGKEIVDIAAQIPSANTIVLGMFKLDLEPLAPRLLQNREAHIDYLKYTQEQADILRGIVEQAKAKQPSDNALNFSCKHAQRIQELLVYVRDTCLNANKLSAKKVAVTLKNNVKKVRFAKPLTSSSNTKQVESSTTSDSYTPVLSPTGLKCSTSNCGSKPTSNKKNDRILRTPSRNMKNKVEAQPRKVNKKNRVVEPIRDVDVKHSLLNANSEPTCATCKKSMFDGVYDMCLLDFVENVNSRAKSAKKHKNQNIWKPTGHVFTEVGLKWKPTGRTFTIVGNSCPLTRITSANVVPPKKTTSHSVKTQKLELKVYSRKPKNVKNVGSSKKAKIVESKNANHSEPNHTWGSNATDIPSSSSLVMRGCPDFRFRNNHIARILGYGDYQLGNVTISRVYYVEGLGHNLFSVGQFFDADLEVAFRKNTCFIHNLEGVDRLSGSRDTILYTISLDDMIKTSPICLLSKASKTKSWLWHRRLSHLNFGTLNKIAKDGLARGIPRLKFQKDHLCSACALGKSKKSSHQPKAEDTNQETLYLLHMDLCGLMRVASINEKSSGPGLHSMTLATPSLGLVLKLPSSAQFVPPSRKEWDLMFKPMFDEFYSHLASVASPVLVVKAPAPVESTRSPSSTTVDQDAPSPSTSQTTPQSQSQAIPLSAKEESHDLEVAHMSNNPYFGIQIPETVYEESSSSDIISTTVHPDAPISEHPIKWTKDHLIQNIIVEPNTYKEALTLSCWIKAMQEELNEFERLEVWELVPPPDKVMVITLKWIYKVKLDELGGILKNKARLMGVKTAFLNGILCKEVYISQPDGFVDPDKPNHVYGLKKALYGLKQAPRAWYDLLSSFLLSQGFSKGTVDPTLFISIKGKDILLISQSPRGIFLNQSKYARESLKKYGMESYDPVDTPVDSTIALTTFANDNHVGCQDTRRSISRSMQLLGDRLVSWSSKRQKSAAISSMEAEYIALSGCCAQVLWMRSQLTDYGLGFNKIPMYRDNKSAIALCCNNVQHSRSKHIDIRYHFIKEQVKNGVIELYFVKTEYQLADIFTKVLCRERFEFFIDKLGMRSFTPEILKELADEAEEIINTTQAQQKALDDAFVAPVDRLEFGKCNMGLKTYIKPKEATFQVVLHALALTPFYQAFLITTEVPAIYMQEFWATVSVHKDLGHTKDITYLTDVNIDYLHQPWRAFATVINKCLSGKKNWNGQDSSIENKDAKKTNKMSYPRFTKIIIDYFLSKDQSISRRNKMFWHNARDDTMFTSMRCISRHEDTQVYGTILPKELTNQAMLESKAYQTYYAFAFGEKDPKPKYIQKKADSETSPKKKPVQATKGTRLKTSAMVAKSDKNKQPAKISKAKGLNVLYEVALTEAEQMKLATKRSKTQFHISHASGSSDGVDTRSKVPDEQKQKVTGTSEGAGVTLERVSTPPDYELSEEEEYKEDDDKDKEGEQKEEEEDELYRDLNINLERSDAEMNDAQANQDIKYTHVTLTNVPPVVQQQSSSVSSNLVSKFINPSPDTSIDSILYQDTQSDTLINVPVSVAAETLSSVTTIPQPPIPNIQPLQQTPTSTTTTTNPTMTDAVVVGLLQEVLQLPRQST
ncbi:retrovirus-related pol polyprotein from transposon TNT 1-94 [Tanacetum coccineum]